MARALKIAVWPGMPDPDAIDEAGRRIGREVETTVISSNDSLEHLIATEPPFDLITPSDYLVARLRARDGLLELDRDRLPRLESIAAWVTDPGWDPGNLHSVPFAFGTTGYLYDRDIVGAAPSWNVLFAPEPRTRVGLLDEVREVVGAALIAAGCSPNATDSKSLDLAQAVLADCAGQVASVSSDDFVSPVEDGTVVAHHAWSGPAAMATRNSDRLAYALPAEGALFWVTTAAVPADAPEPDASHELIAALMEPELASLATRNGGYSTPDETARAALPPELRDDPVLFPPADVLDRCIGVEDLGGEAEKRMEAVLRASGVRS
jgi:spermidine/putrescine transport system substrate-binding protein